MQPGLKVRGREYLRIVYGPDYTDSLDVLRERITWAGSGSSRCASTASASTRSRVRRPASRCGGCTRLVFAVLALESEPVDPRL